MKMERYDDDVTGDLLHCMGMTVIVKESYGFQEKEVYRGIRNSRNLSLAMNSALPPRMMSVPRPAMFVAIVTDPNRPLWETISASLSAFSGLAFNT
jgi:hypothetical protein